METATASASATMELLRPKTGVYIAPHRLRRMQQEAAAAGKPGELSQSELDDIAFQRDKWESLKRTINALINKVTESELVNIAAQLFAVNLIRGRGVLCRSLIQAQAAIPSYSPVYAALVSIINSKIPEVGEILAKRLVKKFRDSYTGNNHDQCVASLRFIANLVNQRVLNELVAFEMLGLFLENPTEGSVELAVELMKEVGPALKQNAKRLYDQVIRQLRDVLQEGVGARVDAAIKGLLDLSRVEFHGKQPIPESLDLVEEDDRITHTVSLSDKINPETKLDVFSVDPQWQLHEDEYADIRRCILGEDEEPEPESDDEDGKSGDENRIEGFGGAVMVEDEQAKLISLRRKIYLTIMSSLDYQEVAHKLFRLNLKKPEEIREIANMVIECCSNERSMIKMYAALGQRLAEVDRNYRLQYQELFEHHYQTIQQYGTLQLNNIAKFYAHLLYTDAIHWSVLSVIKLTEEDTKPAHRIFIKVLFREMSEYMGIVALQRRLQEPLLQEYINGIFPLDSTKNMRFSINFFTASGLGGLTQHLRDELKKLQQKLAAQASGVSSRSSQMLDAAHAAALLLAELDSDSDSADSSSPTSDSDLSSDTSTDFSSSEDDSGSDTDSTEPDSESSDSDDYSRRKRSHRSGGASRSRRSRTRSRSYTRSSRDDKYDSRDRYSRRDSRKEHKGSRSRSFDQEERGGRSRSRSRRLDTAPIKEEELTTVKSELDSASTPVKVENVTVSEANAASSKKDSRTSSSKDDSKQSEDRERRRSSERDDTRRRERSIDHRDDRDRYDRYKDRDDKDRSRSERDRRDRRDRRDKYDDRDRRDKNREREREVRDRERDRDRRNRSSEKDGRDRESRRDRDYKDRSRSDRNRGSSRDRKTPRSKSQSISRSRSRSPSRRTRRNS